MLSYIQSEIYRIFRNKGSYLFILISSALLVSANVILAVVKSAEETFPYATTKYSLGLIYTDFVIILFLCISLASMVFGNEHGNHTMKNSISYGISRGTIYFGKLIVEIIYSIIAFVVICGIHTASAYLLLEDSGSGHLMLLLKASLAAVPVFLSALGISNCFLFILESTGAAIGAISGILLLLTLAINMLAMKFSFFFEVSRYLPLNLLNNLGYDRENFQLIFPFDNGNGYLNYWLIGLAELIVISAIGFIVFRKKEVK